jgi:hypothetical protein
VKPVGGADFLEVVGFGFAALANDLHPVITAATALFAFELSPLPLLGAVVAPH